MNTPMFDRDQCIEMFDTVIHGCDSMPLDGVAYHILACQIQMVAKMMLVLANRERNQLSADASSN
jgi:hypothetical protein